MSEQVNTLFHSARRRTPMRPWRMVVRFFARMVEVRRTRGILAELDPRMLADIGVSRSEAQEEIARAAWDFEPRPRPWRRPAR